MGYWVGQNIKKILIEPGLAGWWLRPWFTKYVDPWITISGC